MVIFNGYYTLKARLVVVYAIRSEAVISLFSRLNDVVAVDKQSFYVTNYLYWRGSVASKIEMFLMLKWGSVLFYDGEKSRVVRDGLFMTNGINKSPDNR